MGTPNRQVRVADLAAMEQQDLGYSDWLTVDQARIDRFADATEDHQWIHVDPARAAAGPFGTTIAHGYLTLSLVPHFMVDLLSITDEVRGTNYGVNRARFPHPVAVGARIRMNGRIGDVQWRADGGLQYSVHAVVQAENVERPALVVEVVYLSYAA
jgi:acyl dehydratase